MAVGPESKIEKHLKKEVEKLGGKVRKLRWIGKNGAPDRLVWFPARPFPRFAFVEVKAPGKKPTKIQSEEHAALRADGFQVFTVDSIEAADHTVKALYVGKGPRTAPPTIVGALTDKIDLKSPPDLPQDNSDLA